METFDSTREQPITLTEAAARIPRQGGKKTHLRTIERWIRHGSRGVYLEAVRFGRTFYTSAEALQRFGEKSAVGKNSRRTPGQASKSHKRARRQLEKAGFGKR